MGGGGATRSGCKNLNIADNDALRACFEFSSDANKDVCVHCKVFKVLAKNITKRMQHIAGCPIFKRKCNSEDVDAQPLQAFRDRVILACDGYQGNSQAMEAASE